MLFDAVFGYRWLLFDVCRVLFIVSCLLCDGCCLLFVVRCVLFVVCCLVRGGR